MSSALIMMHSVIPAGGGGILSITDLSPTKSTKLPNEASGQTGRAGFVGESHKRRQNTTPTFLVMELGMTRRALIELVRRCEIEIKDLNIRHDVQQLTELSLSRPRECCRCT